MLAASWLFFFISRSHVCVCVYVFRWWLQHQSRHEWNRNFINFILCNGFEKNCISFHVCGYVSLSFSDFLCSFFIPFYIIIWEYLLFGDLAVFSRPFYTLKTHTMCVVIIMKKWSLCSSCVSFCGWFFTLKKIYHLTYLFFHITRERYENICIYFLKNLPSLVALK